jgi:hypothetical protein
MGGQQMQQEGVLEWLGHLSSLDEAVSFLAALGFELRAHTC